MIHDKISNFNIYPLGVHWSQAFKFIKSIESDCIEKTYQLEDGMFAMIMSYPTRPLEKVIVESHRKYVDIQWTISGAEGIKISDTNNVSILEAYDSERDVEFYHLPKRFNISIMNLPGRFSAFWPNDIHSPQLRIENISEVKKGVIKIPIDLLTNN